MHHKPTLIDNNSRAELAAATENQTKEIFNQLCDAARKLDALGVYKILNNLEVKLDSIKLDKHSYDSKSVIMQMAEENNIKAVEILINECKADPKEAVEGFARAKQGKTVARYLEDYAAGVQAVRGYAFAGDVKEMNTMLNYGAPLAAAAYGAARAGNNMLALELMERNQADANVAKSALKGLIHSNLQDDAEHMILRATQFLRDKSKQQQEVYNEALKAIGSKLKTEQNENHHYFEILCETALQSYFETWGFLNSDKLLNLLATTKDEGIVRQFEHYLNSEKKFLNPLLLVHDTTIGEIIQKASTIRHAIHTTPTLTFAQALASGIGEAKTEPKQNVFSKLKLFTRTEKSVKTLAKEEEVKATKEATPAATAEAKSPTSEASAPIEKPSDALTPSMK